jgi:hypothetical protein
VAGKCINPQAYVYAAAGLSIAEDIVIMLLPIWELSALKLDLRKRFALGFMFALGSLYVSQLRPPYLIANVTQRLYHQHDPTQIHRILRQFH